MKTFKEGGTWDSLNGSAPTSSSTSTRSGERVTINRFADGSITITSVETLPSNSGIHPNADLQQCSLVSSANYVLNYRCGVHTNVVVGTMFYTVYFTLVHNFYDSISSVSGLITNCTAGSCTGQRLSIVRKNETASLPAAAQATMTWVAYGGAASRDYILVFEVRNDKYTAYNN